MTTVAFDGKTLAADTCMVGGGKKYRYSGKIRRLSNGCLAGFCGGIIAGQSLLEWLEGLDMDNPTRFKVKEDVEAMMITPPGDIVFCDRRGGVIWSDDKVGAIGSGGDLALGAILAGATAIEAVKIAIMRDQNSGFDVISLDL